jgi:hypothetical protein
MPAIRRNAAAFRPGVPRRDDGVIRQPGSPVHTWRMWWRTTAVKTIPTGKAVTELTKNLRAFIPVLVDFADDDGSNKGRTAVGQALIAKNVGCSAETVAGLYLAAEAAGLIEPHRTPKGQVRGYTLLPHLPGFVPDWDAAIRVLKTDRRHQHKHERASGSSSRDRKPAPRNLPSRDEETSAGDVSHFSSRDSQVSRHVTDDFSSRDETTRYDHGLNHEMAGVGPQPTDAGAHPGEEQDQFVHWRDLDDRTTPAANHTRGDATPPAVEGKKPLKASFSVEKDWHQMRENLAKQRAAAVRKRSA